MSVPAARRPGRGLPAIGRSRAGARPARADACRGTAGGTEPTLALRAIHVPRTRQGGRMRPMKSWLSSVARIAAAVEEGVDRVAYPLRDRVGHRLPPRVVPYAGYGTRDSLLVLGRVLRDEPLPAAAEDATLWDNLVATYRRFETDEVRGARLRLTLGTATRDVLANEEGYFEASLPAAGALDASALWHDVQVELVAPREAGSAPVAVARALVPPVTARFGVVSDIDDTVVRTDATQLVRMARTVFLGNARTRLPFPGVAALYRALQSGVGGACGNPLFYVSSSPWNLYELLVEFFDLQRIPRGPLVLRDWGISPEELIPVGHASHKLTALRRILATYPELPFILIGDSGQEDPEIYAQIIREFPGRVHAAYIRNVSRDEPRRAAIRKLGEELAAEQHTLLLLEDSLAAARHAAGKGWIDRAAVDSVAVDAERDAPD